MCVLGCVGCWSTTQACRLSHHRPWLPQTGCCAAAWSYQSLSCTTAAILATCCLQVWWAACVLSTVNCPVPYSACTMYHATMAPNRRARAGAEVCCVDWKVCPKWCVWRDGCSSQELFAGWLLSQSRRVLAACPALAVVALTRLLAVYTGLSRGVEVTELQGNVCSILGLFCAVCIAQVP